jgi:hypothetical protein
MTGRRRQARLAGRRARVDGIPYVMPVNAERSPALMAGFSIDSHRAAELLPGGELHPLRLPNGRGVLLVTVIDYLTTDIGRYVEFSIAIACTHGPRPAPPLLPVVARQTYGVGQYVLDLPVSSEVSVKGGKGIWGMPKHQANLDFRIDDREASSQYDLDGRLAVRISVRRDAVLQLPLRLSAANYCSFRGMLMKSLIHFDGPVEVGAGRRARAELVLGDSPVVDPLRSLDLASRPLFTAVLPSTDGILDDHFESWFLTYDGEPPAHPEGLESVAGLGQGQEWLTPPRAAGR